MDILFAHPTQIAQKYVPILLYLFFLPFSICVNVYVASNFYSLALTPIVTNFDESIFFISFGLFMIAAILCILCKFGLWPTWSHFVLINHSFLICYFTTNSPSLSKLLLGLLAIYLSTMYDIITVDVVHVGWNARWFWKFQRRARSCVLSSVLAVNDVFAIAGQIY